jgi:hypothetical protein
VNTCTLCKACLARNNQNHSLGYIVLEELLSLHLATGIASLSFNAWPLCNKKKEEENKSARANLILHLLF